MTETIREALEQMRQRQTQNAVRKLHGKIKFGIDHDMPLITRDSGFRHFAEHCGLKLA